MLGNIVRRGASASIFFTGAPRGAGGSPTTERAPGGGTANEPWLKKNGTRELLGFSWILGGNSMVFPGMVMFCYHPESGFLMGNSLGKLRVFIFWGDSNYMIVLSYMNFCVLYWVTIVLFLAANGLGIGLIGMCMYIYMYTCKCNMLLIEWRDIYQESKCFNMV